MKCVRTGLEGVTIGPLNRMDQMIQLKDEIIFVVQHSDRARLDSGSLFDFQQCIRNMLRINRPKPRRTQVNPLGMNFSESAPRDLTNRL